MKSRSSFNRLAVELSASSNALSSVGGAVASITPTVFARSASLQVATDHFERCALHRTPPVDNPTSPLLHLFTSVAVRLLFPLSIVEEEGHDDQGIFF